MLSCECEFDDPEWWYDSGAEVAPLATRRARKCCSCSARIAVGEDCKRFRRWRTPAPESIEERIYGEDGEVSIAAWYLCDRCTGLYESLESLGFCGMLGDNLIDTCREYAQMQRDAGVFRGQMVIPTRPQGHLQESNMSKISVTNGKIIGVEQYGNGVLLETTPDAVVIVNGLAAITAADMQQAMAVEVASDKPVGPRDLFTRPWKAGDRNPTEMEQIFKPEWFKEYGKNQPAPQTGGGTPSGGKVPFTVGGKLPVPYPLGNQRATVMTGVTAGMCALALGKIGAGRHPGNGTLSLTGATLDTCPIKRTAFATEAGVFEGPSILGDVGGQTNRITANFVVGKPGGGGYGPQLPTDKDVFFNVEFADGVPAEVLCDVAAHDR